MIRREWRRFRNGESLMTDPVTGQDTWPRVILCSLAIATVIMGTVVLAVAFGDWLASTR